MQSLVQSVSFMRYPALQIPTKKHFVVFNRNRVLKLFDCTQDEKREIVLYHGFTSIHLLG